MKIKGTKTRCARIKAIFLRCGVMEVFSFFLLSVYINKYKNRVRGKETTNKKVSTFTLFSQNKIQIKQKRVKMKYVFVELGNIN